MRALLAVTIGLQAWRRPRDLFAWIWLLVKVNSPPDPARLYRVGEVVARPGLWLRRPGGSVEPLAARGFDHLKA
jgi:hypothetical protein